MLNNTKCSPSTLANTLCGYFVNIVKHYTIKPVEPNVTHVNLGEFFFISLTTQNQVLTTFVNHSCRKCRDADG